MKTLENKMLSKGDIDALINAPSLEGAMKMLLDKGYGKGETRLPQKLLEEEQEKIWQGAKESISGGSELDVLMYPNDFHNLKTIMKAYLTGMPWENLILMPCITNPEEIYKAIERADFSDLPGFLRSAAGESYKIVTSEHDGRALEIYLDKKVYEEMKRAAAGNEFLEKWLELNVVFTNITTALRVQGKSREFIKNALIPTNFQDIGSLAEAGAKGREAVAEFIKKSGFLEGAKALEKSLSEFEKWCDNKKVEHLKAGKNKFFGIEPIMAFLLGKENELQTLRIILSGKKNNISSQVIRERLRDLYA